MLLEFYSAVKICDNMKFCIPERNGKTDNNPAQNASSANAYSNISLDQQEYHCSPKDNLQAVQDGVCFETLPPAKARHVLGEELICDEDNGFGRLEGGRWVSKLFFVLHIVLLGLRDIIAVVFRAKVRLERSEVNLQSPTQLYLPLS